VIAKGNRRYRVPITTRLVDLYALPNRGQNNAADLTRNGQIDTVPRSLGPGGHLNTVKAEPRFPPLDGIRYVYARQVCQHPVVHVTQTRNAAA
jgi:hypothetical protein